MQIHHLTCEFLSPVHIGTGTTIEPTEYYISKGRLTCLDINRFMLNAACDERVQFEELVDGGNLIDLRRFVTTHIDPEQYARFMVRVTPQVETQYAAKCNDIENQLLIHPFVRSGVKVIIPGSALKGAIRTAVVSYIAGERKVPSSREYHQKVAFESNVLGYRDAKSDPFRAIKIGDACLEYAETVVREIVNVSRNAPNEFRRLQMLYEITESELTGRAAHISTRISIDNDLIDTHFFNRPLNMEQIVNCCNTFYRDKMEYEHDRFYKFGDIRSVSNQLLNFKLKSNEFLLRVGRFSGVESVTLDKYRNPRPPGKKKVWGTTRNLAEGFYPMGWIKCTLK